MKKELQLVASICTTQAKNIYTESIMNAGFTNREVDDVFLEEISRALNIQTETASKSEKKMMIESFKKMMNEVDEIRVQTTIFGYKEPTKTEE